MTNPMTYSSTRRALLLQVPLLALICSAGCTDSSSSEDAGIDAAVDAGDDTAGDTSADAVVDTSADGNGEDVLSDTIEARVDCCDFNGEPSGTADRIEGCAAVGRYPTRADGTCTAQPDLLNVCREDGEVTWSIEMDACEPHVELFEVEAAGQLGIYAVDECDGPQAPSRAVIDTGLDPSAGNLTIAGREIPEVAEGECARIPMAPHGGGLFSVTGLSGVVTCRGESPAGTRVVTAENDCASCAMTTTCVFDGETVMLTEEGEPELSCPDICGLAVYQCTVPESADVSAYPACDE